MKARKGQAEVVGGLLVLTLIFMFAVPLLLNTYSAAQKSMSAYESELARKMDRYNEMLSVTKYLNDRGELVVILANLGIRDVTLDKIYFIGNDSVQAALDLRNLITGPYSPVLAVILNGNLLPLEEPVGVITLRPNDNLTMIFNRLISSLLSGSTVLVESSSGVVHPRAGAGVPATFNASTLIAGGALWRGLFYPQSGFILKGANDLVRFGVYYSWVPPIFVKSSAIYYYTSFIYDDPDYPGLYRVVIIPRQQATISLVKASDGLRNANIAVPGGFRLEVHGYLGTYYAGDVTYISGYAFRVVVYNPEGVVIRDYPKNWGYESLDAVILKTPSVTAPDWDGNGVSELVFYSLLNGPLVEPVDINADADAYTADSNDALHDSLAWTYVVARDISGVDYIRVTAKINYYWTATFYIPPGCPDSFRNLRIFAVQILRYDNVTGKWRVYQYQGFDYTNSKPEQFQPTLEFPVERTGVYRVAITFYDNYRDFDNADYSCYIDFTYTLEHLIVEYGIANPFFKESPPVYIVAIPDPKIISGIGEEDYMQLRGLSSLEQAKIEAQSELLSLVKSELQYAGASGFVVINSAADLYRLLFATPSPPRYAVIIWLQGNVSFSEVLGSYGVTDANLADTASKSHWVWVWITGAPLNTQVYFSNLVGVSKPGLYNLTITQDGQKARSTFYAFYLPDVATFNYTTWNLSSTCVVPGTVFYWNSTATPVQYGTVAYWIGCSPGTGAMVVNPVNINWSGRSVGVSPETAAQQIVYAALTAWSKVRGS